MPEHPPLGFEPRQQRGVEARDRLYAAALRLYGEHGVADTRVEDIVAEAGAAWGTFFRYFPRKEDVLLRAGKIELGRRLAPLVTDGIEQDVDPRTLALNFFREMLTPGDFPLRVKGAIVREIVAQHYRYQAMLGDVPPTFALVHRIVEQGMQRGVVRDDENPVLLAGVLACGVIYPTLYGFYDIHRDVDPDSAPSPLPMIDRTFDVAWRGLASG